MTLLGAPLDAWRRAGLAMTAFCVGLSVLIIMLAASWHGGYLNGQREMALSYYRVCVEDNHILEDSPEQLREWCLQNLESRLGRIPTEWKEEMK